MTVRQVVRVLFSRQKTPVSLLVRTVTWSDWSHVEILDGAELIGAELPGGVVVTPLAQRLAEASAASYFDIRCDNPAAVIEAARGQLGKGYDLLGLLGFVTPLRDWQQDSDWFCSELVAWAFDTAGYPLFRPDSAYRITPQHLWLLPFESFDAQQLVAPETLSV